MERTGSQGHDVFVTTEERCAAVSRMQRRTVGLDGVMVVPTGWLALAGKTALGTMEVSEEAQERWYHLSKRYGTAKMQQVMAQDVVPGAPRCRTCKAGDATAAGRRA